MSRVDFYHLQKQSLDEVLPKLLEKAYQSGKHILVKTGSSDKVEAISSFLWTFRDDSFLPHATKNDGFAEEQIIFITADDENANNADFLFLINGAEMPADKMSAFERIFNIFDGNSEAALTQSRQFWKTCKDAGFNVYYWYQSASGKWEQKG